MSKTSSRNTFDETEENGFDHISMVYIKELLFTGAGKKKTRETPSRACLPSCYHPVIHFGSWKCKTSRSQVSF